MTTNQPKLAPIAAISIPADEPTSTPASRNLPTRAKNFIGSHLVETITVFVTVSLLLLGGTTWNIWTTYLSFRTTITNQFKLQSLSDTIIYVDEVLTMSAGMAATTGDPKWEKRYHQFEPVLDHALEKINQLVPEATKAQQSQTSAANAKLYKLEYRTFALVRQGKREEAFQVLNSQEYQIQKQIYSQGTQSTLNYIKNQVDVQLRSYSQRLLRSVVFAAISFPLLLLGWLVILSLIKTYIRERKFTQDALLESQKSLLKLNEELETRAVELLEQKQATNEENQVLQADVVQILDVVSALEEGDLTVQATVSDRMTGLVADTLNRLIEELAQIMSVVLSTAQQVTQGADEVEQLAARAAQQTQQQAQSVSEVQALVVNFNDLSQKTAQQAVVSDEAVQQVQGGVTQGQQEMATMSQESKVLHQATEQIVKRAQMLTNFVGLSAQFAKDQKRVAALTRVLALNASMIAARASEQQDPEQFASVAREFETIATQVNDLAVQTNQSLLVLQQRTDQIQTVVSGINQDLQEITNSVNQVNLSVQQSHQVFDNIKTATDQVAQVGQQITTSSQAIATTAQSTLRSIQDIAKVTAQTEQHSRFTREQAGLMDQLARTLLEKVRFFRLSADTIDAISTSRALPATPATGEATPWSGAHRDGSKRTLPQTVARAQESGVSA